MDFKENIQNIDIGKLIKQKFDEKSMTKEEFADKINKERSTVYDIFDRKSIDIMLLIAVSKALEYDFIRNVYYKEQTVHTVHISIKIVEDVLKNLDLLDEFICYVRSKR